jgi:hypothetical protein
MRTVELLLDPRLEHGVRDLWNRLHDAGLPSLATHRHPTNRPHLTVLTATSLTGLPPLPLPVTAELGPVRMLGRSLVREVTSTPELRRIHADIWSALPGADPWPTPPDWIPHVSLALNVPADLREPALRLLATVPAETGQFVAGRSYDTGTRTVADLYPGA